MYNGTIVHFQQLKVKNMCDRFKQVIHDIDLGFFLIPHRCNWPRDHDLPDIFNELYPVWRCRRHNCRSWIRTHRDRRVRQLTTQRAPKLSLRCLQILVSLGLKKCDKLRYRYLTSDMFSTVYIQNKLYLIYVKIKYLYSYLE